MLELDDEFPYFWQAHTTVREHGELVTTQLLVLCVLTYGRRHVRTYVLRVLTIYYYTYYTTIVLVVLLLGVSENRPSRNEGD